MADPLELTTEQQFEMARIARTVERLSPAELQQYVMELHRHHFAYQNTVRNVISKDLSGWGKR